mgnify:CR=1 FL=1
MKKLIINADDLGYTKEINKAIIYAFKKGVVTSASIMANMPAFSDAVKLCKKDPKLDIGIHLNITTGKPVLNPNEIKSLIDSKGNFSLTSTLIKLFLNRINLNEIEKEFDAQIKKVISANLKPTHLDSHHHLIHIFPGILNRTIKLMKMYNLKWIRVPDEKFYNSYYNIQLLNKVGLSFFSIPVRKKLYKNNLKHTGNFFGLLHERNVSMKSFKKIIGLLSDKEVNELCCHPGYENIDYLNRKKELKILTSKIFKDYIKEKNVKLINFRMLK